jgi:HNH endonuclease
MTANPNRLLLRAATLRAARAKDAPIQPRSQIVEATPYLEPHHTRRLTDGGPDDVRNAIGLCPTCHRRVHHADDGTAYNFELRQKLEALEPVQSVRTTRRRSVATSSVAQKAGAVNARRAVVPTAP